METTAEIGDPHHRTAPGARQVDAAVAALAMLAEPTRFRILWQLTVGPPQDVGALAAAVGVSATTASQHLAKLRMTGLVDARRSGRFVIYRARGGHVRRLIGEALSHADHALTGEPDHE